MIAVIFDIQNDLKNLLKEQSKFISVRKSHRSSISKNKKKSTTKRKSLKK